MSAETAMPNASDSQTACAPRRRAVSSSPAPPARATCAVVPYWRKLKIANVPPRIVNAIPSAASCGPSEMSDDRRVDEEVERLGRERAQRGEREPDDLAVVLGAERHAGRFDRRLVRGDVVRDHLLRREALLDLLADHDRVERVSELEDGGILHVAVVVDDDSGAAVLDDLGDGAAPRRDDRRPARHRLDHHQAERLLPVDGEMSARAPMRSSTLSACPTSPTYSIEPPRCGRMNSSK